MNVGSLFSGIGGLDLGLERAGHRVIWQAETDPYASTVLARHWPDVPNLGDVAAIDWSRVERPDLICGGFPCQPVSEAGLRRGRDDVRWLWPEFARCLRQVRPDYALMENVPGLLTAGLGDVLGDLAEIGFDAVWDCLPAAAYGAHFIGDRVFILASSTPSGCRGWEGRWPYPLGAHPWGRDELEGLVRLAVESGVPAGSLGRVSDGVPRRVDRLRCLGNAVLPQQAEYLGRLLAARIDGQADG